MARKAAEEDIEDEAIEEEVLRIIADHLLGLPSLVDSDFPEYAFPETTLDPEKDLSDDFGADELDKMELIMAVEEVMNVDIDYKNSSNIRKVEDLIQAVREAKRED